MDQEKLTSAVLYLLKGCPVRPGLTSLLKMIYFADYWHFQRHLSSITGSQYVAMERGPVISDYWKVFEGLEKEGLLKTEDVRMAGHPHHPKKEFVALVEPDEDIFLETELEILNQVIAECGRMTGTALSQKTHQEGPWPFIWDAKQPCRQIPYTAFRWLANLPDENDIEGAKGIISQEDVANQLKELNGVN